jgi:hypothetical protein
VGGAGRADAGRDGTRGRTEPVFRVSGITHRTGAILPVEGDHAGGWPPAIQQKAIQQKAIQQKAITGWHRYGYR